MYIGYRVRASADIGLSDQYAGMTEFHAHKFKRLGPDMNHLLLP